MTLSEAFNVALEARGLTIHDLAALTALEVDALRRIASDNARSIKFETLGVIAEELQLSFHWKSGWTTEEMKA